MICQRRPNTHQNLCSGRIFPEHGTRTCTGTHRNLSGLTTALAYVVGDRIATLTFEPANLSATHFGAGKPTVNTTMAFHMWPQGGEKKSNNRRRKSRSRTNICHLPKCRQRMYETNLFGQLAQEQPDRRRPMGFQPVTLQIQVLGGRSPKSTHPTSNNVLRTGGTTI